MTSFLLDTNIIVDAFRRRNNRDLLIEHLLAQGQPLASCAIIVTEIYSGMRPNEEKPTRAFMKSLMFLPATEEIAERAGYLKAHYSKRGKTLSVQDVMIASVSIAYGCTLVTENVKDFPMPELQLYSLPKNG